MEGTHVGAIFERPLAILDELMLYANASPVNSAGCEYNCRWLYGLEKTFPECAKCEHVTGDKKGFKTC